jgi:hypothetical protein
MKLQLKLLLSFTVILPLSSCGVITKARYGNGLKLNIESSLFARKDKSEAPKTPAKKKKIVPQVTDEPMAAERNKSTDSFASITSIQSGSSTEILNTNSAHTDKKKLQKKEPAKSKGISKVLNPIKKIVDDKKNKKIEPNTEIAAWLFYGSLVLNALLIYSGLAIPGIISALLSIASILGVVLAFVGLRKIKLSGNEYKGYGTALSIIILFFLSILYLMFIIALLFLLL